MTGRIVTFAAAATLAVGALTAISQPAQADTCVTRSPENLAAYNEAADQLVASNQLTPAERDLYRCHPEMTAQVTSVSTRVAVSPAVAPGSLSLSAGPVGGSMVTAATACAGGGTLKIGINHVITSGATPEAFSYYSNLRWCYNKRTGTVHDWSGECVGSVTTWGKVNGWVKTGCIRNDFVPYALGGHYPGGVDHITKYQFANNFTVRTVTVELGPVYIWGHFDGTCDWRQGNKGTVYHYC